MYHLRVTVTFNLTSNLIFRIIVSGASLIVFEVGIPNLCVNASWNGGLSPLIFWSL